MKLLWVGILTLIFNLGCGGYGSGMGTTPAPVPNIAPSAGTYSTPLTVTISDSLAGAVIYVTTDGSAPSLSSPVYHGPFSLTQPGQVQVRAIAAAGGYSSSPVAVATFTLQ
ncbi:MAG TPA: chitobiase/beta-hexosaminidase C-terminal domain-containing protein [Candidatus Eisenbacteria bacterium]|nr:chitobiase/beta-hexosaminidase C-terminal domain-containing protein [Candidatus Eisenbacteria bacterium]